MPKGIPRTETIWEKIKPNDSETYYITSKANDRSVYFIYKMDSGKAVKLGKNKSPPALRKKYIKGF